MSHLLKESIGELHQPVVVRRYRRLANPLHVLMQTALAPVVSRGLLSTRRFTQARSFQQGYRGGRIERGVVSLWERVITSRHCTTSILVHECA
jgi:hypothetical protein